MKNFFKQFGGRVSPELIREYEKSDRWIKGKFRNLERTKLSMSLAKFPRIIYKQFITKRKQAPQSPLPVLPFDKELFLAPADRAKMIWYGHSAIMMRVVDKTILIDPMLGSNTTPIAPVANRRFSADTLSLIDDFPDIDLVCITHDHYDHLDYQSIQKLLPKVNQYFVALGVKRHLTAWGVDPDKVTEFEWYDSHACGEVEITFTPTQHFSGRGLRDRMMTLWGGWLVQSTREKIWFSGDGGYGKHFLEIGKRYGPIDFAFMECGQYNDDWRPVHLFPDESVRASLDAQVQKAMPVHWGGFDLSYQHNWYQPPKEFVGYAKTAGLDYALPRIGDLFTVKSVTLEEWWKEFVNG
jgi:L-ascorbate metabolism protein UlaG (beta-lactamase superfamily)